MAFAEIVETNAKNIWGLAKKEKVEELEFKSCDVPTQKILIRMVDSSKLKF